MIELHRQNSREQQQQYHSAVLELTLAREGSSSNEATVCAGGVLVGPQGCIAGSTLHTTLYLCCPPPPIAMYAMANLHLLLLLLLVHPPLSR